MGSCFSIDCNNPVTLSTVKVISSRGTLLEYSVALTVSEVLGTDASSCFLCHSDNLFYDDYIPPLDPTDQLQLGQIYFMLPRSRLQYRLKASDMAALAVRASGALGQISAGKDRRRCKKKIRISPALEANDQRIGDEECDRLKTFEKQSWGISRSWSVGKLRSSGSRRAKGNSRSFTTRLTTIYEGSIAG